MPVHIESYRLLGKTALDRAAKVLDTCLSRWAEGWCVDSGSGACQVSNVDDLMRCSNDDGVQWYTAGTQSAGCVAIGIEGSVATLANEFLPMAADNIASAYADAVAEESLRDLAQTLLSLATSEHLDLRCETSISHLPHGLQCRNVPGALSAEAWMRGCRLHVRCDSVWVGTNLPLSLSSSSGLSSIEEALQDSAVAIECQLDLGEIPLAEAGLLQPGHVVRTNMPIGQVSHLDVIQGGRIADCKIGRQDECRAIEILSI